MVGREVELAQAGRAGDAARRGRRARRRRARRCAATAARRRCADVVLSVRDGEIVGVAGVAGNGQRELAEAITGMRPATAGVVYVGRRKLRIGDPRAAIAAGVAHVPEDRLGTGVAPSLSDRRELGAQVLPRARRLAGPAAELAARSASARAT